MSRRNRSLAVFALAGTLALGGVACSDEDGDGATTDEEVNQIEEGVEGGVDEVEEGADQLEEGVREGADELQQEVDQGEAEVDGEG